MSAHIASLLKLEGMVLRKPQTLTSSAPVRRDEPIAVVGMGCRFPAGANSPEAFWDLLISGTDGMSEVPTSRFDVNEFYDPQPGVPGKMYTRKAGFLNTPVDLFDAEFFGITPKEVQNLDPQQRLLLEVTWEALEHALIPAQTLEGSATGVYVGIMNSDYDELIRAANGLNSLSAYSGSGSAFSAAVGRISYVFGFQGPCLAIDTACSSSLVAINSACEALRLGQCQQAIAGGVNLMLSPSVFISECQAKMLSPDGYCKTFDKTADGFARSEGCGLVVLKRLEDAQRDGDKIYAVIKSSGVNHGGTTSGLTVPNGLAQEALLRSVASQVSLKPDDIDYVEAHGTGTSLGDPIEVQAIGAAYGERDARHPLLLGSVKSAIGHGESAAGIAGVIKTILALNHETLPANLHFKQLNPQIELNFPAQIVVENTPWPKSARLRRAGVSSFGFSGINAHVILEEAPAVAAQSSTTAERPLHLLTLSARAPEALAVLVKRYIDFLAHTKADSADICYSANTGRNHEPYRLAVLAPDALTFKEKLDAGDYWQGEALEEKSYTLPDLNAIKDWKATLTAIGQAYVAGAVVDWRSWDAPYARQKIHLPSYPFERKRHWAQSAVMTSHLMMDVVHPLLGEAYTMPDNTMGYRGVLQSRALPYLLEHQVYDEVIYPAAGYLEMMIAAGWHGVNGAFHLQNISIENALGLREGVSVDTQLIMKPTETGYTLGIYSQHNKTWTCHAQGQLSLSQAAPNSVLLDLALIKSRCSNHFALQEFYEYTQTIGITYGPVFQTVVGVDVGDHEVLGELSLSCSADGYLAHPALLDGALQLVAVSLWQEKSVDVLLPVGCEAIDFYAPLGESIMAYWQERRRTSTDCSGDLTLYDKEGRLLARLQGMHYRKATEQALKQMIAHEDLAEEVLYEWVWQEKALETTTVEPTSGHWLLLGAGRAATALVETLMEQGSTCEVLESLHGLQNIQDYIDLLASQPFTGIIHMTSMMDSSPVLSVESLTQAQVFGTQSLLYLTQALLKSEHKVPLVLVTKKDDLTQSPLNGFYKTLLVEQPTLKITRVDLGEDWDLALLTQVVVGFAEEPWLLIKGKSYLIPQFLKHQDAQRQRRELTRPANDEFRLQSRQKGLLDNLTLVPLVRQANLSSHEVEVEIQAVGLNFRDVLDALGLYPGDAGPLGGDGAGVVSRVGAKVTRLKPGDKVFGMISGTLARATCTHEDNVAPIPAGLLFTQAATIPTVFLTVYYAFTRSTLLTASDTVLIHAGAGGVGLAAIQIAQSRGARVIATAGSEARRDFLRAQGVEHVFDSRHLTYGQDIAQLTEGGGVDVVLNSLSGEGFIETTLGICNEGARFLEIGKRNVWTKEQMHKARPDIDYHLIALDHLTQANPEISRGLWDELLPLFEAKTLNPLSSVIFPIEEVILAFDYMQSARHIGKIVIDLAKSEAMSDKIKADATYLITGGLGGLGLTLAHWLEKLGAGQIVLTGRRAAPDEDITPFHYESLDMADEEAVKTLLTRLNQSDKPLKGIFHLAEVLDDATLIEQDWSHFETVFKPKVYGSYYLHKHSKDLDLFILFSSVAASLGSPGQSNYAAANAFMDALCTYRKQQGLPGQSLAWGPWSDVGMAKDLVSRHARGGLFGLTPKEGLQALELAMMSPQSQLTLATIRWKSYMQQFIEAPPWLKAFSQTKVQQDSLVKQLEAVPAAERYTMIKKAVSVVVAEIIGLSQSQTVDGLKNFFDMGIDSLMAVELKNRLQLLIGTTASLPATLVYDHPSLEHMSHYLAALLKVDDAPNTLTEMMSSRWIVQETSIPNPWLRVFCFHHAGGSVSAFKGWQKEMPAGVALDLIQLPGRQQRYQEAFISDPELLVAAIIEAIKDRLDKPYLFFAHSIGTMVALEVVQGLKRLNLPLPAHLILSGFTPLYFNPEKNQTQFVHEMDDDALVRFIVNTLGAPESRIHDAQALKLIVPVLRADVGLFEKPVHLNELVSMPITGLHAKEDKFVREEEVQLWSKVTQAGYQQLSMPGTHMSLLEDPSPYIQVINQVIKDMELKI